MLHILCEVKPHKINRAPKGELVYGRITVESSIRGRRGGLGLCWLTDCEQEQS